MRIGKAEKTKLADISLSVLVLMAAFSLAWAGLKAPKTVPAVAPTVAAPTDIPEDAFVIVVDAGHGGPDGGASGSAGVPEAGLNLAVARFLADELTKDGYYVIMTRDSDNALGGTKDEDMQTRREIMQLECVDLVVSIHMNKFRDRTVSGPMVFYMRGSEEGKMLAESVMYCLCEKLGRPQRFANPEDLFVLRVPKAPSVLVECGFLSNPSDEEKLLTEEHQRLLAQAVAEGINDYAALKKSGDR
ncbi:MAG: N-acetylmuramoyl-L-alanine amidase [Clostridiales bacterium]|nr:N-acetylmuramoyl-L-alanine amidase [Clostridiales bacterium]